MKATASSTGFFSPAANQFTFNRGLESAANPATLTSAGRLTGGEQTFNPKQIDNERPKSQSSQYGNTKPEQIERMALDELKKMAKSLKSQIAQTKTSNPLNPHGIRDEKLKQIIAEREQWKQKAALEQRKLQETLEALEL